MVHPFERIKTEQLGDVFYCPDDYRRFRSDTCLELLDQQLSPQSSLLRRCRKLLSSVAAEKAQAIRRKKKEMEKAMLNPADYPWMIPYHPSEEVVPTNHTPSSVARRTIDASEARRMVEELAFLL